MGPVHGQDPPQGPRGLRRLPRPDPRAPRFTAHAVVTGEPDTRKRVRPVRGQAERKRTSTALAPRRSAEPTRTVREQFLVEITGNPEGDPSRHPVADLGELNELFTAWVETVYHRQIHSETGQAPLARWSVTGPFPIPSTDALAEAFLWEEQRTVTRTALVSLQGNTYQVDPLLVGRRVELVFDPFDLTRIQVRLRGVPAGTAIPHRIGRHAHLKARPETPPELPAPTGIDYARLIAEIHQTQLGAAGTGVNYAALAGSTPAGSTPADSTAPTGTNDQLPGQLDLLTDLSGDTDLSDGGMSS